MSNLNLLCQPESVLEFQNRLGEQATATITLLNNSSCRVAYKVKTTAPHFYLVKPSTGVLDSQSRIVIEVTLVPKPAETSNGKPHRFLIMAAKTDSCEPLTKDQWLTIPKEALWERKLLTKNANCQPEDSAEIHSQLSELLSESVPTNYKGLKKVFSELVTIATALESANFELQAKLESRNASCYPYCCPAPCSVKSDFWKIAFFILLIANTYLYFK